MGIKGLTKLLADNAPKAMKEQKFESYFGRKIAVDASMSIYQFLVCCAPPYAHLCASTPTFVLIFVLLTCLDATACDCYGVDIAFQNVVHYRFWNVIGFRIVVGRTGMETLTNEAGEVTSHLQGMFNRTIRYSKREDATKDLTEAVEEGDKDAIEKLSKRTVKVTRQHNDDCKRLLRLMGVPVVEAPCEAEAECAALCINDKVYAVASEDMDSLTFGAPRFLRHLMDPSSKKIPVMEFEVAKVLEELEITMDQFIDLCILCGCDYCDSIKGIGGSTALKLIRQYGSIESILENINKDRYQIPEEWPYEEARRLFKEPSVTLDIPELKWTAPDEEGIVNFLVKDNGFNEDRAIEKIKSAKNKSSQGRLESFFKPVATTSAPLKRKTGLVLVKFGCYYEQNYRKKSKRPTIAVHMNQTGLRCAVTTHHGEGETGDGLIPQLKRGRLKPFLGTGTVLVLLFIVALACSPLGKRCCDRRRQVFGCCMNSTNVMERVVQPQQGCLWQETWHHG
ncbi:hypothetical protein PR202_ga05802 [Eleusine coracana subsp. coracana]|uniref:Flap endonuclease 1 n=1 Tax=Eleusine coracana subsp. coracana TaxID=191504 RepID=A0AAV5BT58_ELECO|nr:hypothetical protein PR202_ga05802 [Eleusine coracana subsp. coracana]